MDSGIPLPEIKIPGDGDRCITIGPMGCAVQLLVQDLPVEAVVDTGTEMSVLGTE